MGFWCHRFSFQQAIVCHWKQPTHTPVRVQPNIEYITSPIRSMDWIHIETIDSHFRFLSRLRAYCSLSVAVYPVLTLTRAGAPFELADLLNKHKDLRCFRCVLSLPSLGHALCVRLCVCVCVCGTLSFPHSNHFFFFSSSFAFFSPFGWYLLPSLLVGGQLFRSFVCTFLFVYSTFGCVSGSLSQLIRNYVEETWTMDQKCTLCVRIESTRNLTGHSKMERGRGSEREYIFC